MHKNRLIAILIIFVMLYAYIGVVYMNEENNKIQETLSRFGSNGSEVREIQTKLNEWGYYNGEIDGIYGSRTVAAVRQFQRSNGLTVDGIAGGSTLAAMGIASGASNTGTDNANLNLLAHLINGEARGESYKGQVAVGAVVLNRISSSSFPNTMAGVIYQSGAFTAVSDGQINLTPNSTARKAAQDAINGWDPTYGCIYYFNPNTATSSWIWSRPQVIQIGKHIFCK